MAHFTAAVYTGFHAAEERLQSQIHTLEGGQCRELTALAGKVIDRRAMRHASRRSWTAPL